jgi:uncharacterized protein (TIGR03437 family)
MPHCGFRRTVGLSLLPVAAAVTLYAGAAVAAPRPVRINSYVGNNPAEWRTETVAARPSAASAAGDAALIWSIYVGDQNETSLQRIAVDAAGNTYAVGQRTFTDLNPETWDVLVAKLDSDGNLAYTTHLGGKGLDSGLGIAADAAGNAYVVGHTTSPNFPLRDAMQARPAGGFISKLGPDGSLVYSTYFGGTANDSVNAIAVDAAGNAYITGETSSSTLPVTPGAFQVTGYVSTSNPPLASTSFVGKLNSAGNGFVYLSYLGGPIGALGEPGCTGGCSLNVVRFDRGLAITLDPSGNVYVAGVSNKAFPTTAGAFQPAVSGPFVAKMNATGSALAYSTGLGGSIYGVPSAPPGWYDSPAAIAVDSAGDAYVAGITASPTFPTTPGAFQTAFAGPLASDPFTAPPYDGFVSELNPTGTALVYSTYLGGPGNDTVNGMAVDAQGDAYVVGTSASQVFPVDSTLPQGPSFLVQLNPTGSALVYSARFPKGAADQGVALDSAGTLHLAGSAAILTELNPGAGSGASILAVSNAAATRVYGRVAPGELVSIWGQGLGPGAPASGVVVNGVVTNNLAGVQVSFDDTPAPLLYISGQQIEACVPYEVAGQLMTTVRVTYNGAPTRGFPLGVAAALPEIFRNPDGTASALNQDGSVNSSSNPAKLGSIAVVFGTGAGQLNPPGVDGSVVNPPTPIPDLDIGYQTLYAGAAPSLVSGVFQINFLLPQQVTVTGGKLPIGVASGSYISETAYIYVAQ